MIRTLTLSLALVILLACAHRPAPPPPTLEVEDEVVSEVDRWLRVRPRADVGFYPNLPADWEPTPNPRYEVPTDRPLEGLRICVDAGHGGQVWGPTQGYTGGTRGRDSGLTESEANLRTALFLWDLLTQAGAEVVMTRTRPKRMTEPCTAPPASDEWRDNRRDELHARVDVAEAEGCDYFIAIHHNAPGGGDRDINYTSVYYYDTSQYDDEFNAEPAYVNRYPDEELNQERHGLALVIQRNLSRRMDLREIVLPGEWETEFGHGVPHGDFHVLRETNLPSVLVESSFMTNAEEDQLLNDPVRARQEALGIFEGILEHFESHPIRRWSQRPPAGPPGS